jgi:hypothetical protein
MEAMKLTPEQLLQVENHMTSKFRIVEHQILTDSKFEQALLRIDHQHELMEKGFKEMDKRFEQMQQSMDKRFEQVDKRFEQIDKRFNLQVGISVTSFLMIMGKLIAG